MSIAIWLRSWLQSVHGVRRHLPVKNRANQRAHLAVEMLENRLAPASLTLTWDGDGSDDSWDNPLNWTSDQVPDADDNAVIDNGATVVLNTDAALVDFTFSNGSRLEGTGSLTVNGQFTWSSGTVAVQTVNANGGMLIEGVAAKVLETTEFNNAGTAIWTRGNIGLVGGATFNNLAGGIFEDAGIANHSISGGEFENAGTFTK